jgi:hypothetical protein
MLLIIKYNLILCITCGICCYGVPNALFRKNSFQRSKEKSLSKQVYKLMSLLLLEQADSMLHTASHTFWSMRRGGVMEWRNKWRDVCSRARIFSLRSSMVRGRVCYTRDFRWPQGHAKGHFPSFPEQTRLMGLSTYMHTYIHTYIHNAYLCTYVCMYVCMYVCKYEL